MLGADCSERSLVSEVLYTVALVMRALSQFRPCLRGNERRQGLP